MMKFNQLRRYLTSIAPMNEDSWQLLVDSLTVAQFDKNVHLHTRRDLSDEIMFINKGIARAYIIDIHGRDYTSAFHFNESDSSLKNVFITDYAGLIKNEPSSLSFETLTEIEVTIIPAKAVKQLYQVNDSWAQVGRIIAEEAYCLTQKRTISLLTMSATKRYQELLTNMPKTVADIPALHLATYLGITPQSLSRIKKSLAVSN